MKSRGGMGKNNAASLAAGPNCANHRYLNDQLIGWTIAFREKEAEEAATAIASTGPDHHHSNTSVRSDGSAPYQQSVGSWCATTTTAVASHWPCSLVLTTIEPTAPNSMTRTALLAPTNDSTIATASSQKQHARGSAMAHSAYARHKDSALRATTNMRPPPYHHRGRSTTPVHQKNIRESSIGAQKCPAPPTTTTATTTTRSSATHTTASRSQSTSASSKHRRRRHRRPTPTSISHASSGSSDGSRRSASLEELRSYGTSPRNQSTESFGVNSDTTPEDVQEDDRSDMDGAPKRHVILAADTEVEVMPATSPVEANETTFSVTAPDHRFPSPVSCDADISTVSTAPTKNDEEDNEVDDLRFIESWSFSVPDKRDLGTDNGGGDGGDMEVPSPVAVQQLPRQLAQQRQYPFEDDNDETGDQQCTVVAVVATSSSASSSLELLPERPPPVPESPRTPTRPPVFSHTCSAFVPIDPPGQKPFRAEDFLLVTKAAAAVALHCGAITTVSATTCLNEAIDCVTPVQLHRILAEPKKTTNSLERMGPPLPRLVTPSSTITVPGFSMVPSRIPRHVHLFPNAAEQSTIERKIPPVKATFVVGGAVPSMPPRASILVSGSGVRWSTNDSKSGGSSTNSKNVSFRHPVHVVIPFAVATSTSTLVCGRGIVFAPGDVVDIVSGVHKNQTGHVVKVMGDLVQVEVIQGRTHRLYLSALMLRRRKEVGHYLQSGGKTVF